MRGYDIWYKQRAAADALPCGIRVYRTDVPAVAMIWNPKAEKPTAHYRFKTIEAREAYIERFVANYAEHQDRKATRKAEERAQAQQHADTIQVGHVFCYSWGYDQTNIEYYQVIAKRGQMVVVQQIASSSVPDSGYAHGMADHVEPRVGHFLADSKPLTKRPYFYDGRAYLSMEFGSCSLWRGGSNYRSWYA